jgi:hypothetical protein
MSTQQPNILERLTIKFPQPISFHQTSLLFAYLTKNIPATLETYYTINNVYTEKGAEDEISCPPDKEAILESGVTVITQDIRDIHGNINPQSITIGRANFEIHPDPNLSYFFDYLRFSDLIPGYDYEEHPKHLRDTWEKTRKDIEQFFADTHNLLVPEKTPDPNHYPRI